MIAIDLFRLVCGITEGILNLVLSIRSGFNSHAPYIQLGRMMPLTFNWGGWPFIKYLYGEFIANVKDLISFTSSNQRDRHRDVLASKRLKK